MVEQTQAVDSTHPLFRFPVTVRVITRDSVVRQQITISKQSDTFAIPLPGAPLSVRFDEGGWLLGQVKSDQTPAELADMAKHDLDVSARAWALSQLAGSSDSAAVAARRFIVLNEHEAALRRMALEQLRDDGTPDGLATAASALRDPDSDVRAQALRTLAQLDTATARARAEDMAERDPNDWVRAAALQVLARFGGAAALPRFLAAVRPGGPFRLRFAAGLGLVRYHTPEAVAALAANTEPSEGRGVRTAALNLMVQQGDTARVVALATRYLDDPDAIFAAAAVRLLARVGGARSRALLLERFGNETRTRVRSAIEEVLRP